MLGASGRQIIRNPLAAMNTVGENGRSAARRSNVVFTVVRNASVISDPQHWWATRLSRVAWLKHFLR